MKLSKAQQDYLANFETHPYARKENGVTIRPIFGNGNTENALVRKGVLEVVERDCDGKITHVKLAEAVIKPSQAMGEYKVWNQDGTDYHWVIVDKLGRGMILLRGAQYLEFKVAQQEYLKRKKQ